MLWWVWLYHPWGERSHVSITLHMPCIGIIVASAPWRVCVCVFDVHTSVNCGGVTFMSLFDQELDGVTMGECGCITNPMQRKALRISIKSFRNAMTSILTTSTSIGQSKPCFETRRLPSVVVYIKHLTTPSAYTPFPGVLLLLDYADLLSSSEWLLLFEVVLVSDFQRKI